MYTAETLVILTPSGPLALDLGDELRTPSVEPLRGSQEGEGSEVQRTGAQRAIASQGSTSRRPVGFWGSSVH